MDFPKVCYLISEEPFLVKSKLDELKNEFKKLYMDINLKEIQMEQLEEEIQTYPFMADKKMLLVDVKDTEETAKIIAKIPDFCCVIITTVLDKRKKLYKTIKSAGNIMELPVYNEKQMRDWIIDTGKQMEINISTKSANLILQICGLGDMHFIYREIVKLASIKEEVTEDLINQVITKTPEYNSFILTDAISKKDKKLAYKVIKVLVEQNEYLPLVLSMINRNFAVLRMLKTMTDIKVKEAGIHPYTIKLLKPHAQKYTVKNLDSLLNICQNIDFDMKNGVNHRIALEKIIGVIE